MLHPDEYLPRAGAGVGVVRRRARDPDAASLITMLGEYRVRKGASAGRQAWLLPRCPCVAEERASLLGGSDSARSCSSLSARLCEIEDSDAEEESSAGAGARQTDV